MNFQFQSAKTKRINTQSTISSEEDHFVRKIMKQTPKFRNGHNKFLTFFYKNQIQVQQISNEPVMSFNELFNSCQTKSDFQHFNQCPQTYPIEKLSLKFNGKIQSKDPLKNIKILQNLHYLRDACNPTMDNGKFELIRPLVQLRQLSSYPHYQLQNSLRQVPADRLQVMDRSFLVEEIRFEPLYISRVRERSLDDSMMTKRSQAKTTVSEDYYYTPINIK